MVKTVKLLETINELDLYSPLLTLNCDATQEITDKLNTPTKYYNGIMLSYYKLPLDAKITSKQFISIASKMQELIKLGYVSGNEKPPFLVVTKQGQIEINKKRERIQEKWWNFLFTAAGILLGSTLTLIASLII